MTSTNKVWHLLEELSNKKGITEIVINSSDKIYLERNGQFIHLDFKVNRDDVKLFLEDVAKMNHREIGPKSPILDGILPDGSRINALIEPYAAGFPAITIRKYTKQIASFDTSPGIFGLSNKWVDFIKSLVKAKMNLVISGGTSVGKTTFLNLLLKEVDMSERIITIEDTLELDVQRPHVVRLEANTPTLLENTVITHRDLVKNSLRMRPDRIILGEVRGAELFDLIQAMNTGHDGSMTSIHASASNETLSRMEVLFQLTGYDIPMRTLRKYFSSSIDFILHLERTRDGERVVGNIMEITGMEGDQVLTQSLAFRENDELRATQLAPSRLSKLVQAGELPKNFFA